MADIFLSYARADQPRIEKLAAALEGAGYSLWWDREIDGGNEFSEEIERELAAASAVLVAWSEHSARSRWVRDEASIALEENKLIAISLDGTPPPIGFKQIHAIDMQSSSGDADLLRGIGRKLEREPSIAMATGKVEKTTGRLPSPYIIAIIGLLLVAGALAIFRPGPVDGLFAEDIDRSGPLTVAVLPLTFGTDPDLDDMEASLAASLATSLAKSDSISVASLVNTRNALSRNLSTAEMGEELGVDYFIEGEVNATGNTLNANLSLIDATSGRTIWSRSATGIKREIAFFELNIRRSLLGMLLTRVAQRRGLIDIPDDIEPRARDAFFLGYQLLFERGGNSLRPDALRQFEVAADIEPDFAEAHAGIAFILADSMPRDMSMTRETLESRQREAAARALELDPGSRLARLATATADLRFEGDIAAALDATERLVNEAPDDTFARQVFAETLSLAGRPREALAQIDQVARTDTINSTNYTLRMVALFQIGDYETIKANVALCPDPCGGEAWLWHAALMRTGSLAAYRADMDEIIAKADRDPWGIPSNEMDTIARGFIMDEIETILPEDGIAEGFTYMQVLLRFGRIDDGFRVANRNLYTQPTIDILWLLDGSRMTVPEALRADPRYHALFEPKRFRGIADYRREQGLVEGLPVFPVKPYEESAN